jgi:hypothetical protein
MERNLKDGADAKDRRYVDAPSSLDLLPVTGGESVGNHVFQGHVILLAERTYPPSERFEE